MRALCSRAIAVVGLLFLACLAASAADKKIVLVAGSHSHGSGSHEFRAGCLLLQQCLKGVRGVNAVVVTNGWPKDLSVFDGAAAILIYADGGDGHPFIAPERLQVIDALMKKGVGLGAAHYGVEVPKNKGGQEFLRWIGGYFEMFWSVNPHWDANFTALPKHPITRGVKTFKINDEWYYHMRFPEGMKGVTPILTAIPPENTRGAPGANSSHGGNPEVQKHKGEPEHVMWAIERPDGGRGFGFTGGHFHWNWGQNDFRKLVLNAIVWTAGIEVPPGGAASELPAAAVDAYLTPRSAPPLRFLRKAARRVIRSRW